MEEGPKIPEELQKKLVDALFDLCIFLHDTVGASQVVVSLQHVSDAIAKQGTTNISIMGNGTRPIRVGQTPDNAPKNQEEVNKVIEELMAKARSKQDKKPDEGKA